MHRAHGKKLQKFLKCIGMEIHIEPSKELNPSNVGCHVFQIAYTTHIKQNEEKDKRSFQIKTKQLLNF